MHSDDPVRKSSGSVGRRAFLGGLLAGGVGGGASGWLLARRGVPDPVTAPPPATGTAAPLPDLDHDRFMRQAIAQARKVPELPFGAVIANAQAAEVVAEDHNRSAESPTFHGEVAVINRCAAAHPGIDWSGLVLYTTAEPCPMCQSAILWAGIPLVVYGSSIPFLQGLGWWQIDIRAEEVVRRASFRKCQVRGGVLEAECNALFLAVPKGQFRSGK
jgi:tRNA(adenine34) deaminase